MARCRDVAGVPAVEIEVVCSDAAEHRARVETRAIDIADFMPPTWDQVRHRAYDAWHGDHVVIDTAGQTLHQSVAALERALASR